MSGSRRWRDKGGMHKHMLLLMLVPALRRLGEPGDARCTGDAAHDRRGGDAAGQPLRPDADRAVDERGWYGSNRADLTAWIDAKGCASAGYDPAHKPVALFDWDNTLSKNDFGDAITFWMIANDKVLQPPGQDWHATSAFLTDAAATALTTACGTTVAAGSPLPHEHEHGVRRRDARHLHRRGHERRPAGVRGLELSLDRAGICVDGAAARGLHARRAPGVHDPSGDAAARRGRRPRSRRSARTPGSMHWLRIYDEQKSSGRRRCRPAATTCGSSPLRRKTRSRRSRRCRASPRITSSASAR